MSSGYPHGWRGSKRHNGPFARNGSKKPHRHLSDSMSQSGFTRDEKTSIKIWASSLTFVSHLGLVAITQKSSTKAVVRFWKICNLAIWQICNLALSTKISKFWKNSFEDLYDKNDDTLNIGNCWKSIRNMAYHLIRFRAKSQCVAPVVDLSGVFIPKIWLPSAVVVDWIMGPKFQHETVFKSRLL